jgi:hypothetical protein
MLVDDAPPGSLEGTRDAAVLGVSSLRPPICAGAARLAAPTSTTMTSIVG